MKKIGILEVLCAVIAVALVKLAFFTPHAVAAPSIIPEAVAQTGILEWNNGERIVTSGEDGAVTYVWDYVHRTEVRKYSVRGGELVLETFRLAKE